ncbi:hypothetical protein [Nocardia sp. NPDC048505]|uniref:hypothetical protein n=1 Tax=unclassified Nocardia TaxID=2637762 RepID=UPI0033E71C19
MRHVIVAGAQPFRPSGITKDGQQQLTSSWRDIGGWIADSTLPGSAVSGNGVLAQGAESKARVTATIPFQIATGSGGPSQAVRLLVNDAVVATGSTVGGWSGTLTATVTVALDVGDRVTVQGWSTHGAWVLSGTGTTLRIAK